jgi:hypothetical protein
MTPRESAPRRRRAGAVLLLAILAGLILWLQNCGKEFGIDLSGLGLLAPEDGAPKGQPGQKDPERSAPDTREEGGLAAGPCALRLDGQGLSLDGRPIDLAGAVNACKRAGAARLLVVGDAIQGELERVEKALAEAGVPVHRPQ